MATRIETLADTYRIRNARTDEVDTLQSIDLKSCDLFRGTGLIDFGGDNEQLMPIPEDRLRQGFGEALVWVVSDERDKPVGFALCADRGEELYLDQISVHPEHGQQGLGARLIRRVILEARERAYKRISLSTFRDVPWNGPFYRSMGFREVPAWRLQPWQKELTELQKSTMDVSLRCFMQRPVKRFWNP